MKSGGSFSSTYFNLKRIDIRNLEDSVKCLPEKKIVIVLFAFEDYNLLVQSEQLALISVI